MWERDDGHMGDDGWGLVMMWSMLGTWILLTAAIVFAIVWAVRSSGAPVVPPLGSAHAPDVGKGGLAASAELILAERLARGDIDVEEYRARLDALSPQASRDYRTL